MSELLAPPQSQTSQYETQIHTNFSGSPDLNIVRVETAPTRNNSEFRYGQEIVAAEQAGFTAVSNTVEIYEVSTGSMATEPAPLFNRDHQPSSEMETSNEPLNPKESAIYVAVADLLDASDTKSEWSSPKSKLNVSHTAVDLIYGMRDTEDNDIERTSYARQIQIDQRIGDFLGENSHVPKRIRPEDIAQYPKQGDAWLSTIADGYWPVEMKPSDSENGHYILTDPSADLNVPRELGYLDHDIDDTHLGLMMLLPKETQDMITKVASLELERRKNGIHESIELNSIDDKMNIIGGNFRGNHSNLEGIACIDAVTDQDQLLTMMQRLVGAPKGGLKATMHELLSESNIDTFTVGADRYKYNERDSTERPSPLISENLQLLNFIKRHTEGRNITQAEAMEATKTFIDGLQRVATKVRGCE